MFFKKIFVPALGTYCLIGGGCTRAPRIVYFQASPNQITAGEPVELEWNIENTRRMSFAWIQGVDSVLPPRGKKIIHPAQSGIYKLDLSYKQDGQIRFSTAEVSVQVSPPVPVPVVQVLEMSKSIFNAPDSLLIGDEAILEWKVADDGGQLELRELINGHIYQRWQNLSYEGKLAVKPLRTAVFELSSSNQAETLRRTIYVKPGLFTGTRKIVEGDVAQLIWQVAANTRDITIEEQENPYTKEILYHGLEEQGKIKVRPHETAEFTLILIGHTKTKFSHTIEVVKGIFNGQHIIQQGDKAVLCWRATPHAKRIWIEQIIRENESVKIADQLMIEGKLEVSPKNTTDYALIVETPDGIYRYQHTVQVRTLKPEITASANTERIYQSANPMTDDEDFMPSVTDNDTLEVHFTEPHAVSNKPMSVYFHYNSTFLSDAYKPFLNKIIYYLYQHPRAIVEVVGYSDMSGTVAGCQRVSEARAEAVSKYLEERGIAPHRILTRAAGRTAPVHFQEKQAWQARENRRAEVYVME